MEKFSSKCGLLTIAGLASLFFSCQEPLLPSSLHQRKQRLTSYNNRIDTSLISTHSIKNTQQGSPCGTTSTKHSPPKAMFYKRKKRMYLNAYQKASWLAALRQKKKKTTRFRLSEKRITELRQVWNRQQHQEQIYIRACSSLKEPEIAKKIEMCAELKRKHLGQKIVAVP